MRFIILFIPLFLFADTWFIFYTKSYHYNQKHGCVEYNDEYVKCYKKYNEEHKPIGIFHDINDKYSITATRYNNSYDHMTNSISISRKYHITNSLFFSFSAGAASGYLGEEIWSPVAFTSMSYEYDFLAIDLSASYDVAFVSARFRIW